jgi:molybdate transport system substrate-binding protein
MIWEEVMRMDAMLAIAKLAILAAVFVAPAQAAEVRVFSSNALKTVLEELAPQFEKASGHKLIVTFKSAAALKADIEKGEAFDVAILTASALDDLLKQGKLAAATRTEIARSGAGVAVRKGAPKPDISTTDTFKRAMLNAKSITFVEQGATGIYLKTLFVRLGIADELKPKIKLAATAAAAAVANGEAEIGMTQISEILPFAGAELVGPLPPEIQVYTNFPAAISASAKAAEPASALIKYLSTPEAGAVLKAKGLEPVGR